MNVQGFSVDTMDLFSLVTSTTPSFFFPFLLSCLRLLFFFLFLFRSLFHVLLLVYILPFAFHPYRTHVGWVRRISFCPISHPWELPMGSCKAASLLFRYHLHINAARKLVERSLMRRQLLLQIFVGLISFIRSRLLLSFMVT